MWEAGVPFILKAGKGLNERRSEVRIQLRDVPGDLFSEEHGQGPNEFVLRMQPVEELYLKMTIKKPGLGMNIVPSEMQLSEQWKVVQLQKSARGIAPRRYASFGSRSWERHRQYSRSLWCSDRNSSVIRRVTHIDACRCLVHHPLRIVYTTPLLRHLALGAMSKLVRSARHLCVP